MSNADQDLDERQDEDFDALADGDSMVDAEERPPLKLEVEVENRSACERHVVVSVSREDVDRYLTEKVDELMPEAEVAGFRPGRAPRKLVESRFKKQLGEQVKGALLLDAMTQVTDADGFSAISEPDFDFDAVEIPDEGPFTFEFDIEVRPDFDLPKWEGLAIDRPTREFSEADVDGQLQQLLAQNADLVPHDGAAEMGDYVVLDITSKQDGKTLTTESEVSVCVRPKVTFPDASLDSFGELMVGAKAGDKKTAKVTIAEDCENEEMAGKEVELEMEVLDVKRIDKVNVDSEVLAQFGDFENVGDLKDAIKAELERRLGYEQEQKVRKQITDTLTESANWDLPPDLLRRQSNRELQRAIMELRASGFNEEMIKAYENDLRQNSLQQTEKALKEHFILERIAEELEIEADDSDYEAEIALIAAQQKDSVRRVRAKLEKSGQMDALRNQIIERMVIRRIMDKAKFNDVDYEITGEDVSAVESYVSGGKKRSDIPEAKYDDDAESITKQK